jgi:hypothetical protein
MLESFVIFCDVLDASILKSSTPRESMNEGSCERVEEGMFDLPGQRGRQCKISGKVCEGKGTVAPPHASQLTGDDVRQWDTTPFPVGYAEAADSGFIPTPTPNCPIF